MLRTKKSWGLGMLSATALLLAACGSGGGADASNGTGAAPAPTPPTGEVVVGTGAGVALTVEEVHADPFAALEALSERFGTQVVNDNPILDGGELRIAHATNVQISGDFDGVFRISYIDSRIGDFMFEPLFFAGSDFNIDNRIDSVANAYFDRESRSVTLVKNVATYWHDGVPVTLDDLVFAYYVIAHPDYTGPRWGVQISNVVGAQAYRDGEATHIEGLVLSDDKMTLTIYFNDFPPTIEAFGFWTTPSPRHHWAGIAVADMAGHPRGRHEALGNGPFMLENLVGGESIRLVRNDNFWRGRPNLEAVTIEVVDPLAAPMAMQQGLFDVVHTFAQSQFTEQFRYMDNTQFLSNPMGSNSNSWLGFRVGTMNQETGRIENHPEPRLSPTVRRALALSMDHMGAGQLFNGLSVPQGSVYWGLARSEWISGLPTYNHFDPERAMQMLDDAGYVVGADGFRTRPDGSPLVITYLAQTGSPAAELNRQLELQNWHDVGLNVVLYQGRLVEPAVLTEVRRDETDGGVVDMFGFAWNFGASPNPSSAFGPESINNFVRYTSPEWDAIFERFLSDDMWDPTFVAETAGMWEQAFYDAAVAFPTAVVLSITAVNNRVANWSVVSHSQQDPAQARNIPGLWNAWLWGLTADAPYVATN